MGEADGDDPPTESAPTELGSAIDETEANTAWSLDDGEDWPPPRWWTPRRITTAAVGASVVVIGIAATVVVAHLNQPTLGQVSMVRPSAALTTSPKLPPVGPSGFDVPPPPASTVTVTTEAGPPMARGVSVDGACGDGPQFGYTAGDQIVTCVYPGRWTLVEYWSGVQPVGGACDAYAPGTAMSPQGMQLLCVQGRWKPGA